MKSNSPIPVVYIPHGAGPLPVLGDDSHKELTAFLKALPESFPRPRAILMISAHWESDQARVSAAQHPQMIYDYGGFPPETYTYKYPAPGDPELAAQVHELLQAQDIPTTVDPERGYDHGTFVPLMLMYPKAEIPVVQVSLIDDLDAEQHIRLGEALAPLRAQGVLIIGSGLSFHARGSVEESQAFDQWLNETVKHTDARKRLIQWESAPAARACHAREEHLLPLHVCYGAAREKSPQAENVFASTFYGKQISAFLWR